MADEIKKFSSVTGKTYSELYAGTQLHAFSGSQKAVVKDIKIKNESGQPIQIKKDSASTGMLIGSNSSSGTYAGNELCDNSSSIHLKTDVVPVATSIVNYGSYNGSSNTYASGGNNNRGYAKWSKYGVIWEQPWAIKEPVNNASTDMEKAPYGIPYSDDTSPTSYLKDGVFFPAESSGKIYGINGHNGYGYFPGHSGSQSDNNKYSVMVWPKATTNWGSGYTALNTWGGIHLWDSKRYIYVIGFRNAQSGQGEDNIWKYDTVNETSTTFRTRNPANTANVDIYSIERDRWSAYYLEEGGVPFVLCTPDSYNNGTNATDPVGASSGNSLPCIINLNTGQKRHFTNQQDTRHGSGYNSAWSSGSVRRFMGCCQLSGSGNWIVMLGNKQNNTISNNGNMWQFLNLGTSLQNFINTGTTVGRQEVSYNQPSGAGNNMYDSVSGTSTGGWSYSGSNYPEANIGRMGVDGRYYHSQLCSQTHFAKDYLYSFAYSSSGNSWNYPAQMMVRFDMNMAIKGGSYNQFMTMIGSGSGNSADSAPKQDQDYYRLNGNAVKFLMEDSAVSAAFGTIDAECSGVLIT